MKTAKTTKIMSKVLCASALMLPLALPVATQAQSGTPPINVTWSGTPAFPLTLVQSTPALMYKDCLQTNTDYTFYVDANVRLSGSYNAPLSTRRADGYAVTFDPAAVVGSGPMAYTVGVTFHTPSTPTTEQGNFFVALDGLSNEFGGTANADNPDPNVFHGATPPDASVLYVGVPCLTAAQAQPSATPAPSATAKNPSEVVAGFLQAVQTGRNDADYSAYLSKALEQRVANGELVSMLLGIQNDYATFSVGNYTVDAAGRATVTATLNFNTPLQRPMTLVQENGAWQIDSIAVPEAAAPWTPSEVVVGFLQAFKQRTDNAAYGPYLSTALEQRVANGERVGALLGMQDIAFDFTLSPTTIDASGRAHVTATLGYGPGAVSYQRPMTLVQENGAWQIDSIVVAEAPAPSATPAPASSNTVTFKLHVNGTPCENATYWGLVAIYASDGFVYTQLTDADGDGVYTGTAPTFYDGAKLIVHIEQGTGVGQSNPMPGGTPVPVPGKPSRVIADFGTQQQDGTTYRVVNDDFLAEASANGCTAAPSATPTPSATAKPSATASATPKPSAPSALPNTGAGESMLGGLLAAGAAVAAASGGFLLRRRAR